MFVERSALFIYCISPVHMGAGTALGVVDNPIQREVHTGHPTMAGSGLKGAFRDVFADYHRGTDKTDRVFGPADRAADHAGAVSFADAQVVLFPVRSPRRSFVYATCPTALGRLQRLLVTAGVKEVGAWSIPEVGGDDCRHPAGSEVPADGKVVLETYEFHPAPDDTVGQVAKWLAEHAMPGGEGMDYFQGKVAKDLVLLSDERFNHFAKNSTLVEPHVRIDDATGTADDGGLFYTENLPPETLLVSLVMASKERVRRGNGEDGSFSASEVMQEVRDALDGKIAQVGGDATTGRGQVLLRFAGGER